MGRRKEPVTPVDVAFVRECFSVRQDGTLCWRERPESHFGARPDDVTRFAAIRAGQPAGFEVNGRHVVRFMYAGKTRRIASSRVAWAIVCNAWPSGPVLPRNGDPSDLRFENLLQVRHGRNPFGALTSKHSRGGTASALMAALPCRAEEDVEAGSAALRVDWPVYPRRAEHNTVAEGGN
jgi:hypothetical protein